MTGLMRREAKAVEPFDIFDRFDRFDRMFEDWTRMLPFRRQLPITGPWDVDDMIKVDEFRENGSLVVRAELPGIDPAKDVTLTVSDGMLRIEAERREQERTENKGFVRQELRYGSFARVIALPEGASDKSVAATYKDGILEIRVAMPKAEPPKKITITTS